MAAPVEHEQGDPQVDPPGTPPGCGCCGTSSSSARPRGRRDRGRHLHGLALAGEGAPFVSKFAVSELATELGMSTDAGKRYVGKVLEVHHRLPGFWAEVSAGRLQ